MKFVNMELETWPLAPEPPESKFLLEGLSGSVADAARATAARHLQDMVEQGELPAEAIHIQDLHITLTAEVVQQLNMNPQEVRNYFADQIKAAVKAHDSSL